MAYIRFSILFLLVLSTAYAQDSRFNPKSCLDASYKMKMVHKGPLFGLLKQEFTIKKDICVIHIIHKKYLPKEWIIDICREPVHIKVISATGVDVAKKDSQCVKKDNSKDTGNFCSQYFSMMDVIQDDGLIFANGDRDNLASDHGKTYCSYLLIKKYLEDAYVFSRYTEVPDIFLEKKAAPEPAPVSRPVEIEKDGEEKQKEEATTTIKVRSSLGSMTSSF